MVENAPTTGLLTGTCSIFPATQQQQMARPPGIPSHNVPAALRIRGPLNVTRLQQALDDLLVRHESLRTALVRTAAGLEQHVRETARIPIRLIDISTTYPPGHELPALLAETRTTFEIGSDQPLMRAALLAVDTDHHILLLTLDHALVDAWGRAILLDELMQLYAGIDRLPDLPLTLGQYAELQLQPADPKRHSFWLAHLAPPIRRLALPCTPGPVQRVSAIPLPPIPHNAVAKITRLVAEHPTSLLAILATTVATTVSHLADDEVLVSIMHGNRHDPRLRGLIAFLAEPVPLRLHISTNATAAEMFDHITQTWRTIKEHRLPYTAVTPLLIRAAGLPAYDVEINYMPAAVMRTPQIDTSENISLDAFLVPDHAPPAIDMPWTAMSAPLGFFLHHAPDNSLIGFLSFDEYSVKPELARIIVGSFPPALDQIVDNPQQRLTHIHAHATEHETPSTR